MYRRRWRERDLDCVDQLANGADRFANLAPVSDARAQAVRDAWKPLLSGQAVPLIWERVTPDEYDDACYDR